MYHPAKPIADTLETVAVKLVMCDADGRPHKCRFLRLRDLLGLS